jgi:hypothetical protein
MRNTPPEKDHFPLRSGLPLKITSPLDVNSVGWLYGTLIHVPTIAGLSVSPATNGVMR